MTQLGIVTFDRVGVGLTNGDFVAAKVIPKRSIGIEAIAKIEFCLGCLVDECLELLDSAIPDDFPTQNAAREPIDDGYDVDSVFLCSI